MEQISQPLQHRDDLPLSELHSLVARLSLIFFAAVFPMMVGPIKYNPETKVYTGRYSNITAFKGAVFSYAFIILITLLIVSFILNMLIRYSPVSFPGTKKIFMPTRLADTALLAYIILALISAIFARTSFSSNPDVAKIAFVGQGLRNNGFLIQLAYAILFFIISKRLIAKYYDAYIFVFGGFIFSVVCQMHLYGRDIYKFASVSGTRYAGPFFEKRTEFMGPIGNVNLASYVITTACIVAAGLFINNAANAVVKDSSKKYAKEIRVSGGLLTLFAFSFLMWAELNINTDAGLVGLAAGFAVMMVVFPGSLPHLRRLFIVYSVAGLVVSFNKWAVDVLKRGENFGSTGKVGLIVFAVFGLLSLACFIAEKYAFEVSGKTLRQCGAVFLIAATISGLGFIYITTTLMESVSLPPISDSEALKAYKSQLKKDGIDNPIKELGQILHGNFDDRFGHNRMFTWKRTISLLKLQPIHRTIFGNGPDNYSRTLKAHIGDEAKNYFGGRNLDKAHNEFLDVLINNGIIGLIAYLAFFSFLLYYAFKLAPKGGIAPVFGVAIIAYLAHAFFGYQLPIQSPIMWTMIGLCAAFIRAETNLGAVGYSSVGEDPQIVPLQVDDRQVHCFASDLCEEVLPQTDIDTI